eukprot:IDg8730t1
MQLWLEHDYPKIIYTTKEIAKEVMKTASEKARMSTKFVYTTRDELATRWIGSDNYAKIQEIRLSKDWRARASWLENSPQAKLEDYNPLVMSKMFMMRHAARTNPWNSSHFLFLDAKHNCMIPDIMNSKNDHILRAHMFGHFLLTYFDYRPNEEVHGFAYREFNDYLNQQNREERNTVGVGRGGIFGGSRYVIEFMTAMYDVALTATLREGLMGTEENIFSILMKQVPQHIDPFSNNWACFQKVEKDHKCPDRKNQGYNCEIFDWMKNNNRLPCVQTCAGGSSAFVACCAPLAAPLHLRSHMAFTARWRQARVFNKLPLMYHTSFRERSVRVCVYVCVLVSRIRASRGVRFLHRMRTTTAIAVITVFWMVMYSPFGSAMYSLFSGK